MIYIERGPAPADYLDLATAASRKLSDFLDRAEELAQQRVPFEARVWKRAKPELLKRFHDKCAYCESVLSTVGVVDIEQYRPKSIYPHLAYEWDNLLVACRACNFAKGDRFPLYSDQDPLLLDPCKDRPEQHLVFGADGKVVSDTVRGQGTILGQIQHLKENYQDWRVARQSRERTRRLCRDWCELERFLLPGAPYQALAKKLIADRVTSSMRRDIASLLRRPA